MSLLNHTKTLKDYVLFKSFAGERTQMLVVLALGMNFLCYATLDPNVRSFSKLLVQQLLILCIGTMGAKLDRLRK